MDISNATISDLESRMSNKKYHLPDFLSGHCSEAVYKKRLSRKATAHVKRDRKRGNKAAKVSIYKEAIHDAVMRSNGRMLILES